MNVCFEKAAAGMHQMVSGPLDLIVVGKMICQAASCCCKWSGMLATENSCQKEARCVCSPPQQYDWEAAISKCCPRIANLLILVQVKTRLCQTLTVEYWGAATSR